MKPVPRDIRTVNGYDGLQLLMPDFGQARATSILLIHGWSQHLLCRSQQVAGPLAERFRPIAAETKSYDGCDHASCREDPGRNADLDVFAPGCQVPTNEMLTT